MRVSSLLSSFLFFSSLFVVELLKFSKVNFGAAFSLVSTSTMRWFHRALSKEEHEERINTPAPRAP